MWWNNNINKAPPYTLLFSCTKYEMEFIHNIYKYCNSTEFDANCALSFVQGKRLFAATE